MPAALLAQTTRPCKEVRALLDKDPKEPSVSFYERQFCNRVDGIQKAKSRDPRAGLDLRRDFYIFGFALARKSGRASYLVEAEETRVDKQVGAGSRADGTTSLTEKGSIPSILGLAVENGAIERKTNGTTITFRGSPLGIINALANKGFIESYDADSNNLAAQTLRMFSFGLSFDTSRRNSSGQSNVFTGDSQQVSAFYFRLQAINHRDPRRKEYKQSWDAFLSKESQSLVDEIQGAIRTLTNIDQDPPQIAWTDPALQTWYRDLSDIVSNAPPDDVETRFRDGLDKIPFDKLSSETVNEVNRFNLRLHGYLDARQNILDRVAKGAILTFEYIDTRQVDLPDLSSFRMIGETGFGPTVDLTGNVAVTILNKLPPTGLNAGRIRDIQASGQVDLSLGQVRGFGKFILSFSGKFEHIMQNLTSALDTDLSTTKGNVGLGQVKLSIPVKGSGVKIPLSISFATRSELVKESFIRGNFGITFDLDTLFAKNKP